MKEPINLQEYPLFSQIEDNNYTYHVIEHGQTRLFHVLPFLKTLNQHEPEALCRRLDDIIADLSEFYMSDTRADKDELVMKLQILKELRNSLLSGFRFFDFNEHTAKDFKAASHRQLRKQIGLE